MDSAPKNAGARMKELPHSCKCGAKWSGSRTAHCAGTCHKTFSGEGPFLRHRKDGNCLDPVSRGMSLLPNRAYECFGYPGSPE